MLFLIFNALFEAIFRIRIVICRALTVAPLIIAAVVIVAAIVVIASAIIIVTATVIVSTAVVVIASALLVASLRTISPLRTRLIPALLTRLIALPVLIVARAITALRPRLIISARLISTLFAVLIVTRAITSLRSLAVTSTLLIPSVVIEPRTIRARLLHSFIVVLQSGTETFGTEAAFTACFVGTVGTLRTNTWALWARYIAIFSLIVTCRSAITLSVSFILLGRLILKFVV